MPFLKHNNASIYYESTGTGEPVIAVHGLIANTLYWSRTGVSDILAKHFNVVLMDMRGHGKTVIDSEPCGYDAETIGSDINALADHLGFEKFHLISHSTGGFASARYAMDHSDRLLSLSLTGTGSSTLPFPDPDGTFYDRFAKSFEKHPWEETLKRIKAMPYPLFSGIAERKNNDGLWALVYEMIRVGNRKEIGRFVRSFYTDPDPKIDGLKKIACPTLILLGDKDVLFVEASNLMAEHIENSTLVILENTGHMLAIERPDIFSDNLIDFLSTIGISGE